MNMATELVNSGGMSAPAWGFFTALITIVGAILRELIKTRNQTVSRLDALESRFQRLERRIFGDNEYVAPRRRKK